MATAAHAHRIEPPALLERVQVYWVMVGESNQPIVCALYRTFAGELELRAGHGEQDALLRQPVMTPFAAETFAAAWRYAAEVKGFRELDV